MLELQQEPQWLGVWLGPKVLLSGHIDTMFLRGQQKKIEVGSWIALSCYLYVQCDGTEKKCLM